MKLQADTQRIIDAILDGIYIVDTDGFIVAVNKAWEKQIDIPVERLLGRYITDVLREYYFSEQCLRQASPKWKMRDKEFEQAVCFRVIKEGRIRSDYFQQGCLLAVGTPLLDNEGKMTHVLTVIKDLTQIVEVDGAIEETGSLEPIIDVIPGGSLIGNSPEMERVRILVGEVAATDATILISGATGVGKEIVAGEIQRRSRRADKPYIKVNCAAIPENLIESEFFGYEKGAFTGASKEGKAGLFETANYGTVLLDEIGEFPLQLQPKLLRVIQERVVTRVGGVKAIPIDVRIISATNRDLQLLVAEKKFREDLYYRLNVIPIHLPTLKDRGEDLLLLAKNFLQEFNVKYQKSKTFSPGALHILMEYTWPGNIRELRNLVERLVVLGSQSEITAARVQRFLSRRSGDDMLDETTLSLREATDNMQRNLIEAAMLRYGSTYKAAAALKMSQSTLVRKARQLGIETNK